jgi:hypothetical protein
MEKLERATRQLFVYVLALYERIGEILAGSLIGGLAFRFGGHGMDDVGSVAWMTQQGITSPLNTKPR